MILSDKTIKRMIENNELVITPIAKEGIQPGSVDCTIGDHFLIVDDNQMSVIDMKQPIKYREVFADEFIIPPKSFVLATTQEYIKVPDNITAFIEGRSSIGRMGLFIQNAGWVDPGFEGKLTLELYNANSLPIKIYKGRRVGQFVFCTMDQPAEVPYRGKYQGQTTTVGSKIFDDAS